MSPRPLEKIQADLDREMAERQQKRKELDIKEALLSAGLTTEKFDALLKDESDASEEYDHFADILEQLGMFEEATKFREMARDERKHHGYIGSIRPAMPSPVCRAKR
jgi:hypothetical protein